MRYGHLLANMAAAALSMGASAHYDFSDIGVFDPTAPSTKGIAYGPGGHTQGSSRDVDHERHLARLARKARRQERLHRHMATGRKARFKQAHVAWGGYYI